MTRFTRYAAAALMALTASAGLAQEPDQGLAATMMAADGTEAGIASTTGWQVCSVKRTGVGWGSHYVALTCGGSISNQWHTMAAAQKDAMLATALAAATAGKDVQVYIAGTGGIYNEVRALYLMN